MTSKQYRLNPLSALKYFFEKYLLRLDRGVFKVNNSELVLDLKNDGISRALAFYGTRELEKIYLLNQLDLEGKKCLDLGSNIGYYTHLLSESVGPSGEVHCVEPDKRNFKLLKLNCSSTPYQNIKTIKQVAISTYSGQQSLNQAKKSNLSTLVPRSEPGTFSNSEIVDVLTFEDYLVSIGEKSVDMVRMDIEGYEEFIIPQILKNNPKCIILFEVHSVQYSKQFRTYLDSIRSTHYLSSVVSTQGGCNIIKDLYNIKPIKRFKSDGRIRYLFKNIDPEYMSDIITQKPRVLRYAVIQEISS